MPLKESMRSIAVWAINGLKLVGTIWLISFYTHKVFAQSPSTHLDWSCGHPTHILNTPKSAKADNQEKTLPHESWEINSNFLEAPHRNGKIWFIIVEEPENVDTSIIKNEWMEKLNECFDQIPNFKREIGYFENASQDLKDLFAEAWKASTALSWIAGTDGKKRDQIINIIDQLKIEHQLDHICFVVGDSYWENGAAPCRPDSLASKLRIARSQISILPSKHKVEGWDARDKSRFWIFLAHEIWHTLAAWHIEGAVSCFEIPENARAFANGEVRTIMANVHPLSIPFFTSWEEITINGKLIPWNPKTNNLAVIHSNLVKDLFRGDTYFGLITNTEDIWKEDNSQVIYYPNPTTWPLNIKTKEWSIIKKVSIYSSIWELLYEEDLDNNTNSVQISTENLPQWMLIIDVAVEEESKTKRKIGKVVRRDRA